MDESTSALGAMYQAEKTDATGIFNVAMALMGLGVAYLVGAIGTADKYGTASLPWSAVLLLPLPLWLIAAFNSLMTLNSMSHGVSVQVLEDALYDRTDLHERLRDLVGSRAGDQIMDIRRSSAAHKIATIFVYGGVAASVVLYTAWVLHQAWGQVTDWMRVTAVVGYFLAAVLVIASWIAGFSWLDKATRTMNAVAVTVPADGEDRDRPRPPDTMDTLAAKPHRPTGAARTTPANLADTQQPTSHAHPTR
jgi:hypothetical protein